MGSAEGWIDDVSDLWEQDYEIWVVSKGWIKVDKYGEYDQSYRKEYRCIYTDPTVLSKECANLVRFLNINKIDDISYNNCKYSAY